ncbi:uncharacterized protein LOC132714190 [Ruditapes philippinarum]|uniref:uncharacterized protein LOC132714190 n=1 Tax=Ruditapes philippinarum TaxID=129788 RepID=UPI00295B2F21|nr:uncharacterized protein LOC132714190 [Ruditapes philippinarum]
MIQELKPGYCATSSERTLGVYQRTKARSLKVDEQECLPPTALTKRCGPTFPREAVFTTPHENHDMYLKALLEYRIWFLSRVVGSSADEQSVPGFGGFISSTGLQPSRKSTIDYFTPIDQPFTDYAVIEALLEQSEQATKEVGQKYVLSTFDLGGCMKALPLIWKYPERYKYHVITPGAFHTAMNYIGMVTKNKCAGSGYGEILIEAGLVTSGCIQNVLSGKAYAKALFCLKTVTEAMERLLFERFAENMESELNPTLLMKLVSILSRDTLNSLLDDQSVTDFIDQYISFEDSVRHGELGKTAMFWLSVVDHARLVLMLLYAVKTNNLDLFHQCYGQMAVLCI